MTTELFLDLAVSFVLLYVYHSDLHASQFATACEGSDLIFGSHQEYAPVQTCGPDDESWLAESVYAPAPSDWVIDPTEAVVSVETQSETDDLSLAQMFALADSIVPMGPEVSEELAAIQAWVDTTYAEMDAEIEASEATPAVSTETKSATVVQLRSLAKCLGLKPADRKAGLNQQVLNAFADRGFSSYEIDDRTFVPSSDDTEMHVVV